MTLQQLAAEAIRIQDTSNLCGISQRFAGAMLDLSRTLPNAGTDEKATHPITRLWLHKMCDLADFSTNYDDYSACYEACKELAK